MPIINKLATRALLVSILITTLSACTATYMSNVGRTVDKKGEIGIGDQKNSTGQWQTNDVSIVYSFDSAADVFSISGSVHISESITGTYFLSDYFKLFINFIDINGTVISTHNISPFLRYRVEVPDQLPFSYNLEKPTNTVFFAFSYIANFKGSSAGDENMGDWPIFHRPFTDTP